MNYQCELEVTLEGFVDVLVHATVSEKFVGIDDDHNDVTDTFISIDDVFPVVINEREAIYSDFPLDMMRIEWKQTLVDAVMHKMQADYEAWHERDR